MSGCMIQSRHRIHLISILMSTGYLDTFISYLVCIIMTEINQNSAGFEINREIERFLCKVKNIKIFKYFQSK